MTEKQKKASYEKSLRTLKKCNGDCKNCKNVHIYISGYYYAFGCDALNTDIFSALSDTMRDLKKECVEQLEFELDIIKLHEKRN